MQPPGNLMTHHKESLENTAQTQKGDHIESIGKALEFYGKSSK